MIIGQDIALIPGYTVTIYSPNHQYFKHILISSCVCNLEKGNKLPCAQLVIQESFCGEAGGVLTAHLRLCGVQVSYEQISTGVCSLLEFTLMYCAITPHYYSVRLNISRVYYNTG